MYSSITTRPIKTTSANSNQPRDESKDTLATNVIKDPLLELKPLYDIRKEVHSISCWLTWDSIPIAFILASLSALLVMMILIAVGKLGKLRREEKMGKEVRLEFV